MTNFNDTLFNDSLFASTIDRCKSTGHYFGWIAKLDTHGSVLDDHSTQNYVLKKAAIDKMHTYAHTLGWSVDWDEMEDKTK